MISFASTGVPGFTHCSTALLGFSLHWDLSKLGLRKSRSRAWIQTLASASPRNLTIMASPVWITVSFLNPFGDRFCSWPRPRSPIAWRDRRSMDPDSLRLRDLAKAILSGPLMYGLVPIDWLQDQWFGFKCQFENLKVDGNSFYNPLGSGVSWKPRWTALWDLRNETWPKGSINIVEIWMTT